MDNQVLSWKGMTLHSNKFLAVVTLFLGVILISQIITLPLMICEANRSNPFTTQLGEKTKKTTFTNTSLFMANETDADNDGMPDLWELEYGCDPTFDDSTLDYDFDEVINIDEYLLGLHPNNPDTDGDGFYDGVELQKGTDPLDPNDHPVRIWAIILIVLGSTTVIVFIIWLVRIIVKVAKEP